MKILMINSVCGIRSTGRICTDLATVLESKGHQVKIAYGREDVPSQFQKYAVKIGTKFDVNLHALKARLFDASGFGSRIATKRFIKWVKEFDPDVIHLHNIHGYYINVEVLFLFLARFNKPVVWTLHDCWPFTGHCAHFDYIKCDQWRSACQKCARKKEYPTSWLMDRSARNFQKKKSLFTSVKSMTFVAPSNWLTDLVKQSFLSKYPAITIHNGIDLTVFRPSDTVSKCYENVSDKRVVLGVASNWSPRKGLDDFVKLADLLGNDYSVILVGLSEKQKRTLPDNVNGICRTNSTLELAELYRSADVFLNLTYEDNYPTTNLEALACGTPVITYDTGGSPESIMQKENVVPQGDLKAVVRAIERVCKEGRCSHDPACFSAQEKYLEYMKLYEEVL